MTKAMRTPALFAGIGASEHFGGNNPQLRAVYVTHLSTPGEMGSRIKSALVDGLLDISETRPERARALGQAILRVWPGFRGV